MMLKRGAPSAVLPILAKGKEGEMGRRTVLAFAAPLVAALVALAPEPLYGQ